MKNKLNQLLSTTIFAMSVVFATTANATVTDLIVNGSFETGTLAGWTLNTSSTGGNSFYVIQNGSSAPISGSDTQVNPNGGASNQNVVVSGQVGDGAAEIRQSFTKTVDMTSLILSFDWFNNNHTNYSGTGLDYTAGDQVGRVDILTAGSAPFDTGAAVVQNLLLNAGSITSFGDSIPWVVQSTFDLSSLAVGTYEVRFGNSQCCYFQEFGVDNVSLRATTVPEPATLTLMGLGLLGFAVSRRKSLV